MHKHSFALLAVASILGAAACTPKHYKLVDTPFCDTGEGIAYGHIVGDVRYVYKAGDGAGTGPVDGGHRDFPIGVDGTIPGDEMVFAVVRCAPVPQGQVSTTSSSSNNPGKQLTASAVPPICAGQQVLFHGVIKGEPSPAATAAGHTGVMRFPEIQGLTCDAGTLKKASAYDAK